MIQAWWRKLRQRAQFQKILEFKRALSVLVRRWRWYKQLQPALVLQSKVNGAWKAYLPRGRRRRMINNAIRIQSVWRGFRARVLLLYRQRAARSIQSLARGHLARRRARRCQ